MRPEGRNSHHGENYRHGGISMAAEDSNILADFEFAHTFEPPILRPARSRSDAADLGLADRSFVTFEAC